MTVVLGGLTYMLINVLLEIYFPDHWAGSPTRLLGFSYADWSRLLWIPIALLLAGLTGVYAHLSRFVGWLGKAGFILAVIGFGLEIFGNLIEFWAFGLLFVPFMGEFRTGSEGSQLGYSISGYGAMFIMSGLLLLGIASLRSNMPIRWRFLLFSIGLVYASSLYFFFVELLALHAILFGLSWIVVGYFLWKDKTNEWQDV